MPFFFQNGAYITIKTCLGIVLGIFLTSCSTVSKQSNLKKNTIIIKMKENSAPKSAINRQTSSAPISTIPSSLVCVEILEREINYTEKQKAELTKNKQEYETISPETALRLAIKMDHSEEVDNLLATIKVNIEAVDENEQTALLLATRLGRVKIVKNLLKAEANIKAIDVLGWTALHHAAYEGHTEIVKTLLEANIPAESVNKIKQTALHLAVERGHIEIVKILVEKVKTKIPFRYGQQEPVNIVIHTRIDTNIVDTKRQTALHIAAYHGHREIAKILVKTGANPNLKDGFLGFMGKTPADLAKQEGHTELYEYLNSL